MAIISTETDSTSGNMQEKLSDHSHKPALCQRTSASDIHQRQQHKTGDNPYERFRWQGGGC